ncbi:hypothetical protein H206_00461 [Candidatus Electrothrix aarhusensis]|uniref:Uncharacterized protein n=1 Tax=Candidatus Electrothrix aarhusensis TaxID=1859131 RepID=A0A3S4T4N4_9BACT|nr:hypothetical protein H206_00461 [Candidatus Electrothrix aarhusensis]
MRRVVQYRNETCVRADFLRMMEREKYLRMKEGDKQLGRRLISAYLFPS